MRLPKIALVAAACALTAIHARAQVRPVTVLNPTETYAVDTTLYNPAGGGTVAITPGATLTIISEYATTVDAAFTENGAADLANLVALDGTLYKVDPATGLPTGGNIVKQGGGVLQINAWTAISGTQRRGTFWWSDTDGALGYDNPFTGTSHLVGASTVSDLQPSLAADDGRNGARLNGIQGTFTIDQGTVRLAGFLNVWHEHPDNDSIDLRPLGPPPRYTAEYVDGFRPDGELNGTAAALMPRMTGVSGIILNGSSVLELTNSPLNVPTGASNVVAQGSALRVQYLRNLQAGLDADTGAEHDQLQAELVVGTTPEYRAVIHVDQGRTGSIGILAGAGDVVKTGAGDFLVINESRLTGNVTVASGRLILDSSEGRALASAASVSLAGTIEASDRFGSSDTLASGGSRRGAHVRYLTQDIDTNGDGVDEPRYKPAYAPEPGTRILASTTDAVTGAVTWTETLSGAELEIRGDQVIRNFQSNFALSAAPDASGNAASAIRRAADETNPGEIVIAGTGKGAAVYLGGHSLTLRQDKGRDGLYEGKILGDFEFGASLAEDSGSYVLAFDALPPFGTFQLQVTGAEDDAAPRLTASTIITSAAEIRSNIASALGVAPSAITVEDITATSGSALAWRIGVGGSGTLDAALNLRSGKLVLDATSADAKLALNLEQNTVGEIEARAGSLVANAVGLGNSRVNITSGELRIFQNDTGSIDASILGAGVLRVVAFAQIDNGSGTPIEINSNGTRGRLNFAQQQLGFTGELIVNDGVAVSLSAVGGPGAIVDTLANASAITLDGAGGPGSVLTFNDTNQLVRNLSGDARSEIDLGRGTMTLVQSQASRRHDGIITGVGSILKEGAANFAFRGIDGDGVASTRFTGALAVREGSVSLASAGTLRHVSGVALAAGTSLSSVGANQTFGALFGEAGSTVNLGAATLSVGFTPAQLAAFRQQLETSFGFQLTLAHNYLGTTDNAYELLRFTPPLAGAPRLLLASDLDRTPLNITVGEENQFLAGTLGMADQTRLYLGRVLYRADRDGDGVVSPTEEAAAAASAATLGYAGTIIATGADQSIAFGGESVVAKVAVSKTGWETLRLLGSSNQLGGAAVVVRQGILEVAPGALATAGSVVVLANSATLDLDGDGDSDANLALGGVDVNNDGVFDDDDRLVDGSLAILVESGSVEWDLPVLGDGNLIKTGAGTLLLNPSERLYTGTTLVKSGTLELQLEADGAVPIKSETFARFDENGDSEDVTIDFFASVLGAVEVDAGATIALRTDSATSGEGTSLVLSNPDGIVGDGTLAKLGRGILEVDGANVDIFGGTLVDDDTGDPLSSLSLDVRQGTLRFVTNLPSGGFLGRSQVQEGATLEFRLPDAADEELFAEFAGAGKILRSGGGVLALDTDADFALTLGSPGFTGTLELAGGDTSIENEGAFANAKVSVLNAGTSLTLRAGAYSFAGLTGEADTLFALDLLTQLTLDVTTPIGIAEPREDSFLGRFTGGGDLTKTGDGVLSLDPGTPNSLDTVTVSGGTLRATVDGLGTATAVTVDDGAFLEFNAGAGETEDYTLAIGGGGSVSKIGAGTIRLLGANLISAGDLRVLEGTLVVDDRRVGAVIPQADVSDGATLEIRLSADRSLATEVRGEGNLFFDGDGTARTVTLQNEPVHTGLIGLKGLASLAFAPAVGDLTIHGLDVAAGSTVTFNAGQTLTLDQSSDGTFLGAFAGTGNLVIQGPGIFAYETAAGNLSTFGGTITVDGGKLQVGVGNTKEITLDADATLLIDVPDIAPLDPVAYAGALEVTSGTATLVKVGAGTLDLESGIPLTPGSTGTIGTLTVREGKVLAKVIEDPLDPLFGTILDGARIILNTDTSIVLKVDAGKSTAVTELIGADVPESVGTLEKIEGGTLALLKGTARADVKVLGGVLELGKKGGPSATIGGEVTLETGTKLVGSGIIDKKLTIKAGATLAPGFSPGTVTVGTLVNSGTLDLELAAGAYDQVLFNNTAELNNGGTGTLSLRNLDLIESLIAKRFSLVAYQPLPSPAPGAGAFIGTGAAGQFGAVTSEAPVILFYPGSLTTEAKLAIPGLSRDGEVAAYVVREEADYVRPLSGNPYLSSVQKATKVNYDPVAKTTALAATFNQFGARLAVLDDVALLRAVENLRPRGNAAVLSGAAAGFRSHADTLQRRLEQRRFDGADMSVKDKDWFVDATQGQLDLDNGHEARSTGATAGLIRPMGVDGYWAVSLGVENLNADGGSASYKGNGFRLGGALGVMNVDRTLSLDAGLSVGALGGDLSRATLGGGGNVTDPKATTLGLWIRGSAATALGNLALTPFVALEHSRTSMDGTAETGSGNPLGDSLAVKSVDHAQTAARAGFGLHRSWVSEGGDWRYRLGLEVAYAVQIDGEKATLSASHDQLGGGEVPSTFDVLPGDGFSVAPTFTLGPSPDSTFTVGLRLEQGSEGEAASLQLGYRRKF